MVGAADIAMSLVLLCLSTTGVNGADSDDKPSFSERAYNVTYPCDGGSGEVCFYMWEVRGNTTTEYIAIVSNGELQTAGTEGNHCTIQIPHLAPEDVGHHHCQQPIKDLSSHSAPELGLLPNKTASLQCVFLPYMQEDGCSTQQHRQVSLAWVDQAGAAIQEDDQHQIQHLSPCEITLTVSIRRAETRTFRCQAAVDEQTQMSQEFTVGASGLNKRGRRFQTEAADRGGRYVVWGAAGAVACVAFAVVAALFVTKKRRTNSQTPDEPTAAQHTSNNNLSTDDVTYADICFSVGSERICFHECEATDYACIQYN